MVDGAVGLGALGQAALDALPHRAAVVGPDGRVIAVNRRWRELVASPRYEQVLVQVGDDIAAKFRSLRRPGRSDPWLAQLGEVADAIERVLQGRQAVWEREIPAPHGPGRWEVLRVAALPDVGGLLFLAIDVTERVDTEHRLAHAASHDRLTSLPNRAQLIERADAALVDGAGALVAVVELDLDRFAGLNATLGAPAGDRLLAALARRLAAHAAPCMVARSGDDSFAVLYEDAADVGTVVADVERLLDVVSEPFDVQGAEIAVTASAGIAVAAPGDAKAEELLRDAEVATHRAKSGGRGRIVVGHHAERTAAALRASIEQALRRALDRREMWLDYQPEVDVATGRVLGAEALLRWSNPTLGALAPEEFVGVAEEVGLIGAIGRWVLTTACREAASWDLPPHATDVFVAVNVSGHQLGDPTLANQVEDALFESGLAPRRLCLEVNESAVVGSWDVARTSLERLRSLGVLVALDDFGTGYSSFSHLVRLPIDIVKMDHSLVARIVVDPVERAVVESVITLAKRLGLRVVAEGAEHDDQLAVLRSLGCDAVQGYSFGRPGGPAALLDAVRGRLPASR